MLQISLFVSREYFMSGELAIFCARVAPSSVLKVFASDILVFTNQHRKNDKLHSSRNNFCAVLSLSCEKFLSRKTGKVARVAWRNEKGFSYEVGRPLGSNASRYSRFDLDSAQSTDEKTYAVWQNTLIVAFLIRAIWPIKIFCIFSLRQSHGSFSLAFSLRVKNPLFLN